MTQSIPNIIDKKQIEKYLIDNNIQILRFDTKGNTETDFYDLFRQTLIISKNGVKFRIDTANQKQFTLDELLTELIYNEN